MANKKKNPFDDIISEYRYFTFRRISTFFAEDEVITAKTPREQ